MVVMVEAELIQLRPLDVVRRVQIDEGVAALKQMSEIYIVDTNTVEPMVADLISL